MKSWFAAAVLVMAGVVAACSSTGDDDGNGGEGGVDPTGSTGTTGTSMTTGTNMTTGTMAMDCGMITVPDPTCQDCLDTNCCDELKACSDSDECVALLTCQQACTDQACVDACNAATPGGVPILDAVDTCFAGQCSMECGGPPPGGICDSGIGIENPPTCAPCLSTSCCDEFVACSGGTDPNGEPLDAVKIQECLDCLIADPGQDPPGVDCALADAADTCAAMNCAADCGG